jgi:hypothetical protein
VGDDEHRLGAEQVHVGALELAQASCLGRGEQSKRVVHSAGLELRARGGQGAPRAVLGIGCHRRSPLEKGRCGGEAATRLCSGRGTLELRGDVFIGSGFSLRAVPDAAIGIGLGIRCLRQRAVDLAAFLQPGRAVDGRANEGVTEHDARSERQQVFRLDGLRRRLRNPQPLRRPPDERRIADRVGRGHEQ